MLGAVIGRLLHRQVGFGSGQIGTGCRDSREIGGIVDPEKRVPDLKQLSGRVEDLFDHTADTRAHFNVLKRNGPARRGHNAWDFLHLHVDHTYFKRPRGGHAIGRAALRARHRGSPRERKRCA